MRGKVGRSGKISRGKVLNAKISGRKTGRTEGRQLYEAFDTSKYCTDCWGEVSAANSAKQDEGKRCRGVPIKVGKKLGVGGLLAGAKNLGIG